MNIEDLIELGDIDELLREIDRLCEQRNWPGLLELRNRCRAASARGKQLWGPAGHAEYRMALEAPGEFAAPMADADPGRFVLGPLPEVMASSHEWSELVEHLPSGPITGITAFECVVQGEDLSDNADAQQYIDQFGLPLTLQSWEPIYAVAEYKAAEAIFETPTLTPLEQRSASEAVAKHINEPEVTRSLLQLVEEWAGNSNGQVSVVAVEGGVDELMNGIGATTPAIRIDGKDALAQMAWAAASGGAHGRRAGAAAGRAKLWWALANLAGLAEDWPHPADDIGKYVDEVQWWTWGDVNSEGWELRIGVFDPVDDNSFAIEAFDLSD